MQKFVVYSFLCCFAFAFWACSRCDPSANPPRTFTLAFFEKPKKEDKKDEKDGDKKGETEASKKKVEKPVRFYMIFSPGKDSLLSSLDTAHKNKVLLPINFGQKKISFVFVENLESDTLPLTQAGFDALKQQLDTTKRRLDTLTLSYRTRLLILGPDCGLYEKTDSLSVEKTTFDSTVVTFPTPKNDSVNVQIYF